MEKTITIQRNKAFFSILLSIFLFSAFFLNYLNVSAADCGGCGQPACPPPPPVSPSPVSPHPVSPSPVSPSPVSGCTCSLIYSNTPCADISCPSSCGGDGYYYNPPPVSPPPVSPPPVSPPPVSPPPPPPPTCQIISFTINEKCNLNGKCLTSKQQDPLIVWVNASLRGYFSVNDVCISCEVTSNDNWNKTYDPLPSSGNVTEQFKINTAGTYSYILTCQGQDPTDIVTDSLSLQTVKAINLPWWREIIPVLPGF